jgi:hypothetical protein
MLYALICDGMRKEALKNYMVRSRGRIIVRSSGSSRSRSGGFNTVNHTLDLLVSHPWRGRLGGGVGDDGGDGWSFPSL